MSTKKRCRSIERVKRKLIAGFEVSCGMGLDGKVTIVTGAASGIGRTIATRMGSWDATVVVADLNMEERPKT